MVSRAGCDETYFALVRDARPLVGLLKTVGLAADGLRRCNAASTFTARLDHEDIG
jgi:hypothetical protein